MLPFPTTFVIHVADVSSGQREVALMAQGAAVAVADASGCPGGRRARRVVTVSGYTAGHVSAPLAGRSRAALTLPARAKVFEVVGSGDRA